MACPVRVVALVPPRVKYPGLTSVGAATPPAQYTVALPHALAVADVDPGGQKYPGLQAPSQTDDARPDVMPYLPPGHSVADGLPEGQNDPEGHREAVAVVEAAGQKYPAVQLPVHEAVVKPVVAPYRPAGQSLHDPEAASEYLPALHTAGCAVAPAQ